MELETLLEDAVRLVATGQTKDALKLLKSEYKNFANNVFFLQYFGEIYLETGNVEKAFKYLSLAVELDPTCRDGPEKFFYLGQIIGGTKGVELINTGLNHLFNQLNNSNSDRDQVLKKLNHGIFAEIEIYMTDLCMEADAEHKCNELINKSIELTPENPESWSILASIRISQQQAEEAQQAVTKSWDLFQQKKQALESGSANIEIDSEYIELIQPLITLSRFAIELGMYELGAAVAGSVRDIDQDNVDSLHLESFANYLFIKRQQFDKTGQAFDYDSFDQFAINAEDPQFAELFKLIKLNLLRITKISEHSSDEVDPEILNQTVGILGELQNVQVDENEQDTEINEDNWENEIHSDDE